MFAFGKTAIVRTPVGSDAVDAYGDPVAGSVRVDRYRRVALAPVTSTESDDRGRAGVIVGWAAYFPAGARVSEDSTVEIGGQMYEVEGLPAEWSSPFTGWTPGVQVDLRRAEG